MMFQFLQKCAELQNKQLPEKEKNDQSSSTLIDNDKSLKYKLLI